MGIPPVDPKRFGISQDFGENRTVYNSGSGHSGRDYRTPTGTEIVATEDGIVLMAGNSAYFPGADDAYATHDDYVRRLYFLKGGGGNVMVIDHGSYLTTLSHCESFLAIPGQRVVKGQVVAISGHSGVVVPEGQAGSHLHFEVMAKPFDWTNGYYARVNPAPYITEPYFKTSAIDKQEAHVSKTYHHETGYSTPWVKPRSYWGYPDKPSGIAIHHWGNDGQRKEDVAWYLSDPGRNPATATSAHTVLEDGWIATLAVPEVGTFHSGSALGNGALIGIECKPEMDKGTVDTLVQYIYELEQVYGSMDIYYHQELSATACPGRYIKIRNDIITRVNAMHANGGRDPKLKADKKPTVKPQSSKETKPVAKTPDLHNQTVEDPIGGRVGPFREVFPFRIRAIYRKLDDLQKQIDTLTKEN